MAKWVLICTVVLLTACASSTQKGDADVHVGMDKDRVLEVAGNPQHSLRQNGEDHWIFQYYKAGKEWRREVVFDEGKVIKVISPVERSNWEKELQNSGSMEEYEQKARAHQQKADQFHSIDGEPDEPKK
jgi:hypothetical protein